MQRVANELYGKALEIRYIPGLVRGTLDLALTSRNFKTGFSPYNLDIFTDSDFVQAELSGNNDSAIAKAKTNDENSRRRITNIPDVKTHQSVACPNESIVTTSEKSSLSSIWNWIDLIKAAMLAPKK